jgi:hypothetical protein
MISPTLERVLQQRVRLQRGPYRLYSVRDEDLVLYVGQALHSLQRLRAHLGQGRLAAGQPSQLGELILACRPESLAWHLDLYTLEDCDPIVVGYTPIVYPWYAQHCTSDIWLKQLMNLAEQALLLCFRPPLNEMRDGDAALLPEKYARRLEKLSSASPH